MGLNQFRGLSQLWLKSISGRSDSSDRVRLFRGAKGFSQSPNMDINRAGFDIDVPAPNGIQELLPRKDAARIFNEMFQQAEFRWAQMHCIVSAFDAESLHIHFDIALLYNVLQ